jgi:hypothetical protein
MGFAHISTNFGRLYYFLELLKQNWNLKRIHQWGWIQPWASLLTDMRHGLIPVNLGWAFPALQPITRKHEPCRPSTPERRQPARSLPVGDEERRQGHWEREGNGTHRFYESWDSGAHRMWLAAVMGSPADGSAAWGCSRGRNGRRHVPRTSRHRGEPPAPVPGEWWHRWAARR